MKPRSFRRPHAAVTASVLLLALSGCASLPFSATSTPEASAEAPGRVGPEGCGVSSERVSALIDDAIAELGPVQESVLAGEVPDLTALVAPFETDLASLTEGITDPTLLAALERVQTAFTGFAGITAPANVLEAPGYVGEITAQLKELQDAGAALQQLCTGP